MKKFILICLTFIFTALSSNAQTLKAKALDEISTAYPKDKVKLEVSKNLTLYGLELKKGYILTGTLTDVQSPNKGDKEASFTITFIKYKDLNETEHEITKEIKTTYKHNNLLSEPKFLQDAEFSFSPMANLNTCLSDTDITGRPQTLNSKTIKPLSIAESFLPDEYRADLKDDSEYKTGLSNNGEDILILLGDKIKLKFPN